MIGAIQTARSISVATRIIRDNLPGLKHVTYVAARYGKEPYKDPYVRSTYTPLWMARYLIKRYWRVDPVMRDGFRRTVPFDWSEIDRTDPAVATFFADAAAHDVGRSGFLVPLTNTHHQRGILSVSSDLTGEAWKAYKAALRSNLLEVGTMLHRRGVAEVFGDAAPPPRLSPREKEMLRWVSEGKEVPDIAIIASLSEHTIRTYLKSARLKLDCGTMAQAVVKAERLALLSSDEP